MKPSIVGILLGASLLFAPLAYADTAAAPIGNPYTDTFQLWNSIAASIEYIAQETTATAEGALSALQHLASASPQVQVPNAHATSSQQSASLAQAVASFEPTGATTSTEPTTITTSDQTTNTQNEKSAISAPTNATSGALTAPSDTNFVTQDELTAQLLQLSNSLDSKTNSTQLLTVPGWAASQQIGQLNGTTITNANLTASEIPALDYLSLSGGTLTGALNVPTLNASSTNYGVITSTNSSTTDATSTNLFSTFGNFTTGLINTLSGTQLTYTAASTTNFSNTGTAYFGGTGQTTIDSAGDLNVGGSLTLTNALSIANGGTGSTTLSGLLKGNATGSLASAVAGVDYLAPSSLSASYPLLYSGNSFSLGFGTTTNNTWAGTQTFNALTANGLATLADGANVGTNSTAENLQINGPSGSNRNLRFSTANSSRWQITLNSTAESGNNAGSDLQFISFNDSGSPLINPAFQLTRATGAGEFFDGLTVTGTGGLTVNGTTTINGNLEIGPDYPAWSGSTAEGASVDPFFMQEYPTGTTTATSPALNYFSIGDDEVSDSGGDVVGFQFNQNFGANAEGTRNGMHVNLAQTATTSDIPYMTAANFYSAAAYPNGGTGTSPSTAEGSVFGINPNVSLGSNATDYGGLAGEEIDIAAKSGSSVMDKLGEQIVETTLDAVQGSRDDVAFAIDNQGATTMPGWSYGITFNRFGGTWPMAASSTLIAALPSQSPVPVTVPGYRATNGVDFRLVDFNNGAGLAWASPGFQVTGTGSTSIGTAVIGPTASGLSIDLTKEYVSAVSVVTGGNGYQANNSYVNGPNGGIYEVTAVSGSAASAISIIVPDYFATGSLPSNPVSLSGSRGTGLTVNFTWSTANSLVLDPSGGDVGIGTTTPNTTLTVSSTGSNGINLSADQGTTANSERLFFSNNSPSSSFALMDSGGIFQIRNAATVNNNSGTIQFQLTNAVASFPNASLGVGTSSPTHKLSVWGAGTNGFFDVSSTTSGDIFNVLSNGNISIGTTSPAARLSVWGSDTASSTAAFNVVNSASTTIFSVFDGGNAELSGSLSQSSDERLKTNIQALDSSSSLSFIDELNPVTFNWIDPNQTMTLQLGFIAQQVQQIFPNLVSTTSATALTPDGTLSLNYIGLISPIVSAIHALSAEITSIENTIADFAQSFVSNDITANNELCVGSTCVTAVQFQALVAAAGESGSTPDTGNNASSNSQATNTPPVIEVNGDNPAIITVGATYNDLGAIITGPTADLNLGITTYVNGIETNPVQIDTSATATDTIDYVATDQNGLTSTSTRTVIVEAPTIAPTDDASSSSEGIATTTDATTTAQ